MHLPDSSSGHKQPCFGKNREFEQSKLHDMDSKKQAARIRAQEKGLNELADLNGMNVKNIERQQLTIAEHEQLIRSQRETIGLQKKQLALQAAIFTRLFNFVDQLEEQMQSTTVDVTGPT